MMFDVTAARRWLDQLLDTVHLDPDGARDALPALAAMVDGLEADTLYPRACVLMGRAALETGAHALAEGPLRAGFAAAKALDDLVWMTHASAALGFARAPARYRDPGALLVAEIGFARRLATDPSPLAVLAERVLLDLRRAATPGPMRRLVRTLRLGLGAAAQLSLALAVARSPTLAGPLGATPAHWHARLARCLPVGPPLVDVAGLLPWCFKTPPLAEQLPGAQQIDGPPRPDPAPRLVVSGPPRRALALAAERVGPLLLAPPGDLVRIRREARLRGLRLAIRAHEWPTRPAAAVVLVDDATQATPWLDADTVAVHAQPQGAPA